MGMFLQLVEVLAIFISDNNHLQKASTSANGIHLSEDVQNYIITPPDKKVPNNIQ